MNLWTKIKGLHGIGWNNVALAVGYGLKKRRLERGARRALPHPDRFVGEPPGRFVAADRVPGGLVLRFARAELELVFLAPDLARATWTPGPLPLPYMLEKQAWGPVEVALDETEDGFGLATGQLRADAGRDGSIVWSDGAGARLRRDLPPLRAGESWLHRSELRPDEAVFGLGQRTCGLDLRGRTCACWNTEPMGDYGPGKDPLYLSVPVWLGLHDAGCGLLFFENPQRSIFSFTTEARAAFAGGALRCYFIPGPPGRCLDRYTELTGRPALPPAWALGYHQARWSYLNEQEVLEVADGFKRRDLPLSAIHLDIHYMDGYRVFTADPARFPDLPRLSRTLAADGVRLVAIVDPGVKTDPDYPVYRDGRDKGVFCRLPDGSEVAAPVWPGRCAFPDFTDPAARAWWAGKCATFADWGVDGVWLDMNEPAAFSALDSPTLPLTARHELDGRGGDHGEAHNLYALLENRATFEGLRACRPERRPWLVSRSGWAGLQRYAWNWTGDCGTSWWSLRQSVRLSLMLGLSGIPYTGPDIGGFNGEPDPELYARWFQTAGFLPFFRTHSAFFTRRREPWSFGDEVTEVCRQALRLRCRLLPYWYTLAYEAHRTGAPLVRPLWWHWPERSDLRSIDDQFLLGPMLLAAPVMEEGARERTVLLPPGVWLDLYDGTRYEGPGTITIAAPLDRIPLLARAGTIVPMDDPEGVTLHLFLDTVAGTTPEAGHILAEGTLYTDAGDGDGPWRYDRFRAVADGPGWKLVRHGEGEYPAPPVVVRVGGAG